MVGKSPIAGDHGKPFQTYCRLPHHRKMAVPELKAKKVARAATREKDAAAAAKKAASDAATLTKNITARAAAYEAEYNKVCAYSQC